MKRILIAIAMLFVMDADTMAVNMNRTFGDQDVSSFRSSTPPPQPIEYTIPYVPPQNVPLNYHHIEDLNNESVICFKLRRWVFQSISLSLQITAGGLFTTGLCCIDRFPESAKILSGVGLGVGTASLVINTFLLKIENKLENIIAQRHDQENQSFPVIIQR